MAAREPSPKRLRLSPPGDDEARYSKPSGADSAYGSTTATVTNGNDTHPAATTSLSPALSPAGDLHPSSHTADDLHGIKEEGVRPTTLESSTSALTTLKELKMDESEDHRRSDHARQDGSLPPIMEDVPFLCKKPHPRSRPHPTQNLVDLYSLNALASSVARRDSSTGAKINKLRKSYEGKIKAFGLPGRNKPTQIDGELMGFMEWPAEGWYDQRIHGRELEHANDPTRGSLWRDDDGGKKGKVARAVTLNVGRLPKDEDDKWRATLAIDEPITASKAPLKTPVLMSGAGSGLLKPAITGVRASAPASPAGMRAGGITSGDRPGRAGKKRRYDDASFEGYDGGWTDDGYDSERKGRLADGKRRRVSFEVS